MGKKKSRKRSPEEEDSFEDVPSLDSLTGFVDVTRQDSEETDYTVSIFNAIEDLTTKQEKRSSLRLKALESLLEIFRHSLQDVFIERNGLELIEILMNIIKKESDQERVLALRVMSVIMLSLGDSQFSHRIYAKHAQTLKKILKLNSSVPTESDVLISALKSLSVWFLITSSEPADLSDLCELFLRWTNISENPTIAAAAFDAWNLLLTLIASEELATLYKDILMPYLQFSLDSASLDVRLSVGVSIALIYSAVWNTENEETEFKMNTEETAEHLHSLVESLDLPDDYTEVPDLMDELYQLSSSSIRSKAKKIKAVEKKGFRTILHTVEDGVKPTSVLTYGGNEFVMEGWRNIVRLEAIREALKGGFQLHFVTNEGVSEMFDIDFEHSQMSVGSNLTV